MRVSDRDIEAVLESLESYVETFTGYFESDDGFYIKIRKLLFPPCIFCDDAAPYIAIVHLVEDRGVRFNLCEEHKDLLAVWAEGQGIQICDMTEVVDEHAAAYQK